MRNPNYIGHLVNFKTTRKSYKNKRFVYRDPSEWKIIENHHEAIVDKETFDLAQKLTQVKRVVKITLTISIFSPDCYIVPIADFLSL
ncbi:MAG: recombinase family protein [Bacilli bacterium]